MITYILDKGGPGLSKILKWMIAHAEIDELVVIKNPEMFLQRVAAARPDTVLIRLGDIEIQGLKTARQIRKMDSKARIVFISATRDYALDAFDVGANGYLLEPVDEEKLEKLIRT